MRYAAAALAAGALFLIVAHPRAVRMTERVGDYLSPTRTRVGAGITRPVFDFVTTEHLSGRVVATLAGLLAGILVAQGDLFVEGPGRSIVPMAALGAAAGWLLYGMYLSTAEQRRHRRLRFELPVVADTLALNIVAGESVGTAIAQFVESSNGVAAEELGTVLSRHQAGLSLGEALQEEGHRTADEEARRLYALLAHAHDTGGRLAEALTDLSADYRAGLARDLTAEGGRRALSTYGPVLALMVPVTLLFLLYPTLAGLRSLAGNP